VESRDNSGNGTAVPIETAGPMKRLTIDVPETLHRQIKTACAQRGTKIADEVRELLLLKYGKQ